jgi:hypothetical protein
MRLLLIRSRQNGASQSPSHDGIDLRARPTAYAPRFVSASLRNGISLMPTVDYFAYHT